MRKDLLRPARQNAMALVIVLAALVLITILCVAFFASTSRELNASRSYASGVSSRFYADAAVNVVLGQLRAATTQDDATKVWTSQPGLLRQFDNQGKQTQVFKLYSSDKMVGGGAFALLSGGVPADVPAWTASTPAAGLPWNTDPGVYTDLNAPVTIDHKPNYPVLNPGGLRAATRIQGFDVSPGYGLPDTQDLDGDGDTSEIAQIPMPVRWLYILKDGRIATAQSAGDKAIKLALADGGAVADDNPPVARIAFWTDDDTCRLNINTASEGDYWTLPTAVAADDTLAYGQVTAREYQRYPGHPATTSLSPALDFLTSDPVDLRNFIFAVAPRVSGRGSQFGARMIGAGQPVEPDDDRLYASVDDLLFLPDYNPSTRERYRMNTANIKALKEDELDFHFTNTTSVVNMTGTPYNFSSSFELDSARLELLRFFLTVDSNAPEVNLFGHPRVSLWPVDTRAGYQSIYDRLLAFCATVNGAKYYFQRQNPDSRTEDYTSIPRNQELYAYLQNQTGTAIPGLGGTFSNKYGADRNQILTSIFDWIRTVNLAYRDPGGAVLPYDWQPNASGDGTAIPVAKPGSGQVLPIKIGTTSGFGRFPVLSKGAVAIIREEEHPDEPTAGKITVKYRAVFLMETYVPVLGYAAYLPDYQITVTDLANAFQATTDVTTTPAGKTLVDNSSHTVPLTFGEGTIEVNVPAYVEPFSGRAWGGTQGYANLFLYSDPAMNDLLTPRTLGSGDALRGYPFVSSTFEVVTDKDKKDNIRVGLVGNPVVKVAIKNANGSQILSSYNLYFASFGPVPGAFLGDPAAYVNPGTGDDDEDASLHPVLQERINQMARAWRKPLDGGNNHANRAQKTVFGEIDVVRGVEFTGSADGDLRLLAMSGGGDFHPHVQYANANVAQAHSLLGSGGSAWTYGNGGRIKVDQPKPTKVSRGYLVAGTSEGFKSGTPLNFLPQAVSSTGGSDIGDFSSGVGSEGDGPHIIKADEGNSSRAGYNWGMSVQQPYQNQLFPWDDNLSLAFSPNRQVSSAVQLGTLPSRSDTGWRTLLFRPDFAGTHPGASSPADGALLDLFWMPVVDPYPISQPLSTAGKVNMNSQIAPFTYIERSTALLGALKSVKVMAIPKDHAEDYKQSGYTANKTKVPLSFVYDVDAAKTLLFFDERFTGSDPDRNVFVSPSEICSIPLVPRQNVKSPVGTGHPDDPPGNPVASAPGIGTAGDAASLRAAVEDFWRKNTLTGDNALEAPYNNLYPRLTTQSNTYTVYVRAQSLLVAKDASLANLPESSINVSGEYRGSFAVERYIDPDDPAIPDFASSGNSGKTVYPFYKFRIKGARQFLPQ